MADPIRINVSSLSLKPTVRTRGESRKFEEEDQDLFSTPPARADVNFIPSPPALQLLIEKAVEALSRGFYWDRGSIINILL